MTTGRDTGWIRGVTVQRLRLSGKNIIVILLNLNEKQFIRHSYTQLGLKQDTYKILHSAEQMVYEHDTYYIVLVSTKKYGNII